MDTSHAAPSHTGWSAALAFAPVRRGAKAKVKPAALASRALPLGAQLLQEPIPASVSETAVIFAEPVLISASAKEETQVPKAIEEAPSGGLGWGKKIKPPSMILDEDVNGFKARKKNQNIGKGKRSRRKVRRELFCPSFALIAFASRIKICRKSWRGIPMNHTTH